jgi:hypothetical protein
MNYDHYANLRFTEDYHLFLFYSIGPKGNLKKIVAYTELKNLPGSFNLGFGTLKTARDGSEYVDDNEISDNNDRNKLLATIALTVYAFTNKYPYKKIYLRGNDKIRTRLYQMAINHAYVELSENFIILGDKAEIAGTYDLHPFERGINYTGFLVQKKLSGL